MTTSRQSSSHHDRIDADEAAIRSQIAKVVDGLRAKDLDALRELYAADVVSFDIDPPLQHVGIEAKLANWARAFQVFETMDYELRDLTLVIGGDVAFGYTFGRLSGKLKNGVVTSGMWVRVTYGLCKIDGTWRIVHDQVSVPFDILSGKGVVDLEP